MSEDKLRKNITKINSLLNSSQIMINYHQKSKDELQRNYLH